MADCCGKTVSDMIAIPAEIAKLAFHFQRDPTAKFILAQDGKLVLKNDSARDLLEMTVLDCFAEGTINYGSPDLNAAASSIITELHAGRSSKMKLLKRYEDDWVALEFSNHGAQKSGEILLTVNERSVCRNDSLRALSRAFGFTITEAEVVRNMSMALCPKEISEHMDISVNTVRSHLRSIYSKVGLRGYNKTLRLILQLIG